LELSLSLKSMVTWLGNAQDLQCCSSVPVISGDPSSQFESDKIQNLAHCMGLL
jgi:hypothetical protein